MNNIINLPFECNQDKQVNVFMEYDILKDDSTITVNVNGTIVKLSKMDIELAEGVIKG